MAALPLYLLYLSFAITRVFSQPSIVYFTECSKSDNDPNLRINISTVYAQLQNDQLKLTLLGHTGQQILDSSNITGAAFRATTFVTTSVLTYTTSENATAFCSTLRPPSPLPDIAPSTTYCPINPGDLAFSVVTPYKHNYQLTTVNTRIHVVDSSTPPRDLLCIDAPVLPVTSEAGGSTYGIAQVLFWVSTVLSACYWAILGTSRITAAWSRGKGRTSPKGFERFQWFGTVLASAISGEHLSSSPALLRFATPCARDIIFHTQWCTALAMVSVQWPKFVYPILTNTAWATLLFNVTLVQHDQEHWSPRDTSSYAPPTEFVDQINDNASPLYLDPTIPNSFLQFPPNTQNGMASLAAAIGLRPRDLFATSLSIFLLIVAGVIGLSLIIWLLDFIAVSIRGTPAGRAKRARRFSTDTQPGKELSEVTAGDGNRIGDEDGFPAGRFTPRPNTPRPTLSRKRWWVHRLGQGSFHGGVLQGNLVRLLILFHFPVTVFSCYQFSLGPSHASIASLALAAIAFTILSVGIPALLILRLATFPTSKLYDDSDTLLVIGPLYNQYSQGSQIFSIIPLTVSLMVGMTVGAGQSSGTAQAIILLVVEVGAALATSIWLPWGERANMGVMSFVFCVARIVTTVLLVILSPVVSVGAAAAGWITYAILIIQACVYIGFFLMLVVKIIEGLVRLIGRAPFEKSTRSKDTGLIGALAMAGWVRSSKRRKGQKGRGKYHTAVYDHDTARSSHHMLGARSSRAATPATLSMEPPSFLRPEHAFQPYREDNDDETGHIMRAWQPFPPTSGYDDSVENTTGSISSTPLTEVPQSTSGFTRLGGGRARHDSPFAIAATSSVPRLPSSLPPGAKAPRQPAGHARHESQTVVIENLNPIGRPGSRLSLSEPLAPPHQAISMEDESPDSDSTPKRGWFGFRSTPAVDRDTTGESSTSRWNPFKSSRRSLDDGTGGGDFDATDGDNGGASSFVVVRKKRRASAGAIPQEGSAGSTDRSHPPSSFVVVRNGRASSIPKSNSQVELSSAPSQTAPLSGSLRRPTSSGV